MKLKIRSNRYKYARINAGYSQVDVINILGFPTKAALSNYEKTYLFLAIEFFMLYLAFTVFH